MLCGLYIALTIAVIILADAFVPLAFKAHSQEITSTISQKVCQKFKEIHLKKTKN